MSTIFTVIALVLSCAVGIWKYFGRKNAEKRARIEKAEKVFEEGRTERDPSKVTAGFNRIKRES